MDTLVLENKLELSVVEVKVAEVTLKPRAVVVDEIPSTSIQLLQLLALAFIFCVFWSF
jgi:hypothetical protein